MQQEVRRALAEVGGRLMAVMIRHRDELDGVELALKQQGNEIAHVVLNADQLIGRYLEFDYDVEPGSIQHVDQAVKQQRGTNLLALASDPARAQWLQADGFKWNYGTLVADVVRDMGIPSPKRYLERIPPPTEQQLDQQQEDLAAGEDMQMLGGQQVPVNEDDDDASHLRVHLNTLELTQGNQMIAQHVQMHGQRLQQAMMMAQQQAAMQAQQPQAGAPAGPVAGPESPPPPV
jgi:hypothetical protein